MSVTNTYSLVEEIIVPEKARQRGGNPSGIELSSFGKDATTSSTVVHESSVNNLLSANIVGTTVNNNNNNNNTTTSSDSESTSRVYQEDSEVFPEGGLTAWRVVLGSFFGLIAVLGFINSIGAVQAYISSHQLESMSESQISWIFSVFIFLGYVLSGFAGPVFDAFGPYHLTILGTGFFIVGIMMVSLSTTYYQFFLSLGVCSGIGLGMLMTPMVAIVGHWFNYKRGTALGAATIGGSLGGVIFPLILRSLYASVGFAWAIRVVGFLCLFVLTLAIVLMKPRLERTDFQFKFENIIDFKSLSDWRFVWLTLANFLGELAVVNGVTFLTSYALRQGKTETLSYTLLTLLNTMGMLGRWLPGVVADRVGRFNTLIFICIMAFITIFAIWLPFGHSTAGLIVFSILHGFCNGAVLSLAPVCCGQICKARDYGKRYGTMFFFTSFGVLLGVPLSGALIKSGPNGYNNLIIFTGSLYIGTTIFLVLSRYCMVGVKVLAKV
ncbi:hypothetical protein D0Z00_002452 [Geotrichum galactomycetum]|uniref:Uncharacterized protein n=1 Tax=Geotrichum galactomycetum TaxID=27317 RepID=A0ACB6V445_9ASCO|nr:hypothetical protein D0Z00_002452 [Geotrichum candidum]